MEKYHKMIPCNMCRIFQVFWFWWKTKGNFMNYFMKILTLAFGFL